MANSAEPAHLFDAAAYFAGGGMPWSFFAFDIDFASEDGVPDHPELRIVLESLKAAGIRYGVWAPPIGIPERRWLVVQRTDIESVVRHLQDLQRASHIVQWTLGDLARSFIHRSDQL